MHINFPTKSYTLFRCYSGMKKTPFIELFAFRNTLHEHCKTEVRKFLKSIFKYLLTCEEVSE